MTFVVEKDPGLIPQILSQILDGSINGITLELMRLAQENGGRYDGWESPVTTGETPA